MLVGEWRHDPKGRGVRHGSLLRYYGGVRLRHLRCSFVEALVLPHIYPVGETAAWEQRRVRDVNLLIPRRLIGHRGWLRLGKLYRVLVEVGSAAAGTENRGQVSGHGISLVELRALGSMSVHVTLQQVPTDERSWAVGKAASIRLFRVVI